ncbi:MAG TPA: ATP-binding cassette domain-containing protein [Gemmatimonadaceae bacterium]
MVHPPGTAARLDARDVRVVLGDAVAVDGVTLHVATGRCVALVGESGAGKTTLLRCFNRMAVPASGVVEVGGVDVATQPVAPLRRRMGYVPQHGGLLPHWTVLRNAAMVPVLLGAADATAAARTALELVGLPAGEFGTRLPHELSGGQRQRVALARAIAARPGVLLMDEPFGALDAVSRSEVQAVCARLREELGVTTLLVTHDLLEGDFLADELVVMRAGHIEQRGTLDALRSAPATPYVASLLERALAGARRLRDA